MKQKRDKNKLYVFGAMHKVDPVEFLYPVRVYDAEGNLKKEITTRELSEWDEVFSENKQGTLNVAVAKWKEEQSMLAEYDRQTEFLCVKSQVY